MHVTVKRQGNSASICIPAAVMTAANLHVGATVDVREDDGRIVIEPIRQGKSALAALIAGITPENLHAEVSNGLAVGKEAF